MTNATVNKQVNNAKDIIADVKAYSRQALLAGLGVYATTEQQRTKAYKQVANTSSVIFKDLVKAGEGLEKKGKKLFETQTKTLNKQFTTAKSTVTKQINKLTSAAKKTIKAEAKTVEKAAVKVQAKVASKAPVKAKAAVKTVAKAPAKVAAKATAAVKAVQA
jgi:hypothetical protein